MNDFSACGLAPTILAVSVCGPALTVSLGNDNTPVVITSALNRSIGSPSGRSSSDNWTTP